MTPEATDIGLLTVVNDGRLMDPWFQPRFVMIVCLTGLKRSTAVVTAA